MQQGDFMLVGSKGSGKSIVAVYMMAQAISAGRKVVTNIEVFLEYMPTTRAPLLMIPCVFSSRHLSLESLGLGYPEIGTGTVMTSKTAVNFLDELSKSLSARDWGAKDRKEINATIVQLRKYGYSTCYIVQGANMLDAWIREYQIDYRFVVESYTNFFPKLSWMPSVSVVQSFRKKTDKKGKEVEFQASKKKLKGKLFHQKYNTAQRFHIPAYAVPSNASFLRGEDWQAMTHKDWVGQFNLADGFFALDARVVAEYIPKNFKQIYTPAPKYTYQDKWWQYWAADLLYSFYNYPKLWIYFLIIILAIMLGVPVFYEFAAPFMSAASPNFSPPKNETVSTETVSTETSLKKSDSKPDNSNESTESVKTVSVNRCSFRDIRPDLYSENVTDYMLSLLTAPSTSMEIQNVHETVSGLIFTVQFLHKGSVYSILSSTELEVMGWKYAKTDSAIVLSRDQTLIYYPYSGNRGSSGGYYPHSESESTESDSSSLIPNPFGG